MLTPPTSAAADALSPAAAADLLHRMASRRIVVAGDVFLDAYLVGTPQRLSREGPVPVLAFERRFCVPGGAANPARNIAALGAAALQVGVVGEDGAAIELREVLTSAGIDIGGIVVDPGRSTTMKTRIVATGLSIPQQVARIDRQPRHPIGGDVEAAVCAAIAGRTAGVDGGAGADAILVSHYRSGVVTPAVCDAARTAAAEHGIWLTVDAQGDLAWFTGFDLVRVGRQDATASLGRSFHREADYEHAVRGLRDDLMARVVILGRGAEGMSVADETGYAVVRPANVSEVFDVTGAGDTVIAVVTLALAAGAPVRDAVALANRAAGLVVRRLGVAAPTADEIMGEI